LRLDAVLAVTLVLKGRVPMRVRWTELLSPALIILTLSACAPTLHEVADRYSGVDKDNPAALERFRVRHNDCVRMSRNVVNVGPGLLPAAANVANAVQARNDMEQCMADGGYVYIPTPEERAGAEAFRREHCENVHRGRPEAYQACVRGQ
jgi:hypothetical protein